MSTKQSDEKKKLRPLLSKEAVRSMAAQAGFSQVSKSVTEEMNKDMEKLYDEMALRAWIATYSNNQTQLTGAHAAYVIANTPNIPKGYYQ